MNGLSGLFSSRRQDWATPWGLFNKINEKYGPCDLDVCATKENAKCERYFTEAQNGLIQPWEGICWMNPPYGREIYTWINKAMKEIWIYHAKKVICLLPARTDTAWWHDYVERFAVNISFIRGRIKFEGAKNSAPFPSVIVVFGKDQIS